MEPKISRILRKQYAPLHKKLQMDFYRESECSKAYTRQKMFLG